MRNISSIRVAANSSNSRFRLRSLRSRVTLLTLAMVDESVAVPGTEVDFIWGEPDGGTTKPTVEKHRQVTIKAVVASVPYSEVARTSYAPSWRNKNA